MFSCLSVFKAFVLRKTTSSCLLTTDGQQVVDPIFEQNTDCVIFKLSTGCQLPFQNLSDTGLNT